MYLFIIAGIIFAACIGSLLQAGLWSNTITLVNVIFAGLFAMNYFEPLADFFEGQAPGGTYLWDFLAMWLIFGVAMIVLRAVTDYFSPMKVRFFMPIEKAGGPLMAAWVSWLVVCFTFATLHAAPLAPHFLGGSFQPTPSDKMLVVGPDRVWLGWVRRESIGALSRLGGTKAFDEQGDLIIRYGERRGEFDKQISLTKGGDAK